MEYQVAGLPETIQTAVRERQAEQFLAQSQPAVLPSVAKAKRPVAVRRMEQLGLTSAPVCWMWWRRRLKNACPTALLKTSLRCNGNTIACCGRPTTSLLSCPL